MRAKERPDVGDFSSLKFGAAVMVSVAGNKLLKAARKSLKGKGELGGDTDNHGASDANVLGRDSPGRRSWTNTSHINLRGSTASDAPPETVRVVRHTSVDSAIPPSTRHPLAPKTSMSPPKADTGDVRSVEPSLSEMPREPRRSSHSGLRSAGSVRGSFLGRSPVETVDPAWLTDLAQASSRDLSAVPARLRAPQSTRKISYQLSFSSKGLQFIDSEKE